MIEVIKERPATLFDRIYLSEGQELDKLAKKFVVDRLPGESDASLRDRAAANYTKIMEHTVGIKETKSNESTTDTV